MCSNVDDVKKNVRRLEHDLQDIESDHLTSGIGPGELGRRKGLINRLNSRIRAVDDGEFGRKPKRRRKAEETEYTDTRIATNCSKIRRCWSKSKTTTWTIF
eukprot:606278_1